MHLRSIIGTLFAGWMALAISVPADIIWSGDMYLRTHRDVPAIDFNQDGTNDFTFSQTIIDFSLATIIETWIEPTNGGIIIDDKFGFTNPTGRPLSEGATIGANLGNPDYTWGGRKTFLFDVAFTGAQSPDFGGFFVGNRKYLGVSFGEEGETHYGWIELSHDKNRPEPEDLSLMVHGWAWETEADTPILAGAIPEPSSGILTMVGSLALLHLARSRRRKQKNLTLPKTSSPLPVPPSRW